ncbi:MAG: hypothetical protein KatS3mg068_0230 [Candidatus Sericytochromatia bacterium]|nr:MAG: hypothetical protein KatS3mg068_0230 [Candidatus Sericytochromatia bacterium]
MSEQTREVALILRDKYRDKIKLLEYHKHVMNYLFKVLEDTLNEVRADLINLGGDGNLVKFYRSPDDSFVVIKLGDALGTVYSYPKIAISPSSHPGQSGYCGRAIYFRGDYRNLEFEDPDQLTTIEEDSLFIFLDSVLYHLVSPIGFHRTDIPRFVYLILSNLVQYDDSHYSPIYEAILEQQANSIHQAQQQKR